MRHSTSAVAEAKAVAELKQSTLRPASATMERNEAFDFVKGSLVLVMVLYHWLNYFVTVDWDVYRYLRFLTPSFIFITGFLVSHVYLRKYSYDSPQLRRRLVQRGMKLLLIFVLLNLPTVVLGAYQNGNTPLSADLAAKASAIFVTGDKAAAFNILVPIAYFLLLAPLVLLASQRTGISLSVMAAVVLAAAIGASFVEVISSHVELLSVALLGLAAGATEFGQIQKILRRPGLLLLGYLLYLTAITLWNVLFPLQVIGVCLSILLIYNVGTKWGMQGLPQRCVIELGKYSLFAYITQIAILQALRRGLRGTEMTGAELLVPFVVCLVVMIVAVRLLIAVRARSTAADSFYRLVFA